MPDVTENRNENSPEQKSAVVEDIFESAESRPEQAAPEVREQRVEVRREAAPETQPEQYREPAPEGEQARRQYAPPPAAVEQPLPAEKSPELVKIEIILSEHLDELFMQMTPQEQMAFKVKGEETANKVELLLQQAKVKVKEILDLIRSWLQMIPGVNKFFLEQEAKIKTERLLNLRERK